MSDKPQLTGKKQLHNLKAERARKERAVLVVGRVVMTTRKCAMPWPQVLRNPNKRNKPQETLRKMMKKKKDSMKMMKKTMMP